jgi:hypothetical protein
MATAARQMPGRAIEGRNVAGIAPPSSSSRSFRFRVGECFTLSCSLPKALNSLLHIEISLLIASREFASKPSHLLSFLGGMSPVFAGKGTKSGLAANFRAILED